MKQGATTAYYEIDLAGNVRGLRASGGASLRGYRYSAFGKSLEDTSLINQPLRWKGRWYSPVAGETYDVRARQWSPELGIFLSVDEFPWHAEETTLWRRQATRRAGDAGNDGIKLTEDLMIANPQHLPPELAERAIARRIVPCALLVVRAIDLDDEPHLGASEVDDVACDGELPPEGKSGFRPGKPSPEPLLGASRRAAHGTRTLFEELGLSRRNESTSKHHCLQEPGAVARRVQARAQVACRAHLASRARPCAARAARNVRARSSARDRPGPRERRHVAPSETALSFREPHASCAHAAPTRPPPFARRPQAEHEFGGGSRRSRLGGGTPGTPLYRDATFALGFTHFFDAGNRMVRRTDRFGLAIDAVSLTPGIGALWDDARAYENNTSRPLPKFFQAQRSTSAYEAAQFYRNIDFDLQTNNGFGSGGDTTLIETYTRDPGGRPTALARLFQDNRLAAVRHRVLAAAVVVAQGADRSHGRARSRVDREVHGCRAARSPGRRERAAPLPDAAR